MNLQLNIRNIDILLIPPVVNPILKSDITDFIPVGLLVLLSTLSKAGFKGEIYKPWKILVEKEDYPVAAQDILARDSAIIGFSTWCHTYPVAILLAEKLKKINPGVLILFGGPQASILDQATMEKYPFIDFILRGEADESLTELLNCISTNEGNDKLSRIPGLTFRDLNDKNRIIRNSEPGCITNLDHLPVPFYEKIAVKEHLRLDVGRGCPFQCTYCSTNQFFSRLYRIKSTNRIIKEIEYCKQKLKASHFGFSHDTLTVDKKFIHDLCTNIMRYNSTSDKNITWTCSSRTDCVDQEMLTAMAESGCRAMFFGIESGSEKIQKQIKKDLCLDEAHKMVEQAVNLGMKVTVSYMIGFPGETAEDIDKTLRSVLKMVLLGAEPQMTLLSVLPGTPLYNQYIDNLNYDGKTFGMTGSSLTKPVINLVKSDKSIFSSFYYLPNDHVKRKDIIFICNLVNLMPYFMPTIRALKNYLEKDIERFSLYQFITRKSPEYLENKTIAFPELYYFTDIMSKYMEYLVSKGLQEYIPDLCRADFTKAYMQTKYNEWQYMRTERSRLYKTSYEIIENKMIRIIPGWKIIKTNFNIIHLSNSYSGYKKLPRLRKGEYTYLVLPVSDKYCKLFRVARKLVNILENLSDMEVNKFIDYCKPVLDENGSRRLLKKLLKLDMVEIHCNE